MLLYNLRQYLPYQSYAHTTFYHSSGLTRNYMFNGSIYCVLYLQILQFYLVGRCLHLIHINYVIWSSKMSLISIIWISRSNCCAIHVVSYCFVKKSNSQGLLLLLFLFFFGGGRGVFFFQCLKPLCIFFTTITWFWPKSKHLTHSAWSGRKCILTVMYSQLKLFQNTCTKQDNKVRICHRSVTCNRIISMSTGSRFRVLNHD